LARDLRNTLKTKKQTRLVCFFEVPGTGIEPVCMNYISLIISELDV
jgi:hypothetical protein